MPYLPYFAIYKSAKYKLPTVLYSLTFSRQLLLLLPLFSLLSSCNMFRIKEEILCWEIFSRLCTKMLKLVRKDRKLYTQPEFDPRIWKLCRCSYTTEKLELYQWNPSRDWWIFFLEVTLEYATANATCKLSYLLFDDFSEWTVGNSRRLLSQLFSIHGHHGWHREGI